VTADAPSAGPIQRLALELRSLNAAYAPGAHGRWSGRRRAHLVDECLRGLFGSIAGPSPIALAAVGGYGRGELAPASDIDVLLLHGENVRVDLASSLEPVLYPLWDAGFDVGHAVRTPEECVAFAVGRLDAATAMLDARPLAGDAGLVAAMRSLVIAWIREDPRAFALRLAEARRERLERYGSASQVLEPDVKEASGGLRDIDSLGWLAAVVGESLDAPTLDGIGVLRTSERSALDVADEFLVRVRSAIHLETGRPGDRLLRDLQPPIAAGMGFDDEPGLPASDALMRAVFAHARQVEHVVGSAFDRFLGVAARPSGTSSASTAEEALEALARAADEARAPSPWTLDRIEAAPPPSGAVWSPRARDAFLRILRAGAPGARTLEAMDRIDVLERYVPEWSAVRFRPQRDPFHRFTVDVHLLETLASASALLDGAFPDAAAPTETESAEGAEAGRETADSLLGKAVGAVVDRDALLLGAWLHDIGKSGEGSHVGVGVRRAASVLDRMRLDPATRDLALFLVEHHLLLPDTATRRDLGDEELILRVADTVGTPERLAALYLLATADGIATGPHASTPWRRALVRELVVRVQATLERRGREDDAVERLERWRARVRTLVGSDRTEDVAGFLRRVPRAYGLAVSAEQAVSHVGLLSTPMASTEVRSAVADGPRTGTYAVTVVAHDRPGLLSWVAGALTLAGLSVLTAQAFTTDDGIALDLFEVEGAFEPSVSEERWRRFRRAMRRAIEGRSTPDAGVAEMRRRYGPDSPSPVVATIDNEASEFYSVLEVAGPDRIGLLFDITRTLADLELDVHLAKVATYAGRVVDAFYIRDGLGRKVDDPSVVARVERAVADRAG
jgi:[protein-PII] uridylyltransferase